MGSRGPRGPLGGSSLCKQSKENKKSGNKSIENASVFIFFASAWHGFGFRPTDKPTDWPSAAVCVLAGASGSGSPSGSGAVDVSLDLELDRARPVPQVGPDMNKHSPHACRA